MSYITTVTGKHFDPVAPDGSLIDIVDIAHALSLLCRANGHVRHFYSVAQHSVACAEEALARGCSRSTALLCLLHDASEAYISDVTRPVKKDLSRYLAVEERLQNAIYLKFAGRLPSEEEKSTVAAIDDAMLSMEFHLLMPEELGDAYKDLVSAVTCEEISPACARQRFSESFAALAQPSL